MSFLKRLGNRLPGFAVEAVTTENISKYENVFCSNKDYYLITEGRPASLQDCIETIEYTENFPIGIPHNLGFSKDGKGAAYLSLFEGYPEEKTLYIGLFLVDKSFQRNSFGTVIMQAVIDEGFSSGCTAVKLSVQDNNTSGCPFWQKLGFNAVNKIECEGFFNISMELKQMKAV
ncbi:MAG: GNAT family N-acetyltransferase [Clostridia bacterium]|nr:GNAT family N-acetyltransferase [Clostridia bacterium]